MERWEDSAASWCICPHRYTSHIGTSFLPADTCHSCPAGHCTCRGALEDNALAVLSVVTVLCNCTCQYWCFYFRKHRIPGLFVTKANETPKRKLSHSYIMLLNSWPSLCVSLAADKYHFWHDELKDTKLSLSAKLNKYPSLYPSPSEHPSDRVLLDNTCCSLLPFGSLEVLSMTHLPSLDWVHYTSLTQ